MCYESGWQQATRFHNTSTRNAVSRENLDKSPFSPYGCYIHSSYSLYTSHVSACGKVCFRIFLLLQQADVGSGQPRKLTEMSVDETSSTRQPCRTLVFCEIIH